MLFSAADLDAINVGHKTAGLHQPAHHKASLLTDGAQMSDVWLWQIAAWQLTQCKRANLQDVLKDF